MSQVICHLLSQRWGWTWLTVKYEPPNPSIPHTHHTFPPNTRLCFEEDEPFLAVSRGWTKKLPNLFFHFVFVLLNQRKWREKKTFFSCSNRCASAHIFWLTLAPFFTLSLGVVFWVNCWCAKEIKLPHCVRNVTAVSCFIFQIQLFSLLTWIVCSSFSLP